MAPGSEPDPVKKLTEKIEPFVYGMFMFFFNFIYYYFLLQIHKQLKQLFTFFCYLCSYLLQDISINKINLLFFKEITFIK